MTLQTTRVDRFIEQLGRLAEGEGLPRTAGRMMGLLLISGTPQGTDLLNPRARRLRISKPGTRGARTLNNAGARAVAVVIETSQCSSRGEPKQSEARLGVDARGLVAEKHVRLLE
jgi:hypothetical protein